MRKIIQGMVPERDMTDTNSKKRRKYGRKAEE